MRSTAFEVKLEWVGGLGEGSQRKRKRGACAPVYAAIGNTDLGGGGWGGEGIGPRSATEL